MVEEYFDKVKLAEVAHTINYQPTHLPILDIYEVTIPELNNHLNHEKIPFVRAKCRLSTVQRNLEIHHESQGNTFSVSESIQVRI